MKFVRLGSTRTSGVNVLTLLDVPAPPWSETSEVNSNNYRVGFYLDTMRFHRWALEAPLGLMSNRHLLGWLPDDDSVIESSKWRPQTERTYNHGRDKLRYEKPFQRLFTFASRDILDPRATRAASWCRETDTVHKSARGTFYFGGHGQEVYPSWRNVGQYGAIPIPVYHRGGEGNPDLYYVRPYLDVSLDEGTLVFDHSNASEVITGGFNSDRRYLLTRHAEVLDGHHYQTFLLAGYARNLLDWWFKTSSLTIDDGRSFFQCKYRFQNWAWQDAPSSDTHIYPESKSLYDVTMTVVASLDDPAGYTLGSAGVHRIALAPSVDVVFDYELLSFTSDVPIPESYSWRVSSQTIEPLKEVTLPHFVNKPTSVTDTISGFWNDVRVRYPACRPVDRPMERFADWVARNHDSFRGTASLSANDALSSLSSDSNFLESIPELPAVLGYLGNILEFARALNAATKGDPRAFVYLVDALASAWLAYNYGLRPNIQDEAEARRIAHGYANGLIGQFDGSFKNLYGKFTWPCNTAGLGMRGEVKLTTRTKMVIKNDASGLFAILLTLNQVGLLPTLARIWDLVPFSFVLDWFTGLGDRFEYIDNAVLRHGMNLSHYVHTFEYTFEANDGSHPYSQFANVEEPRWIVYRRETSLFHPVISGGATDYIRAPGLNKNRLLIAGALMWVLA